MSCQSIGVHANALWTRRLFCGIAGAFLGVFPAIAQTIEVPNAPPLEEIILAKYKFAIKFPKAWRKVQAQNNELLVRKGKLDGLDATCIVRLTVVPDLRNTRPQDFVGAMSRERFLEAASISGGRTELHIFDTAFLGGVVASRAIFTQEFNGVYFTFISYQTIRGPDIFTVSCYAPRRDFRYVAGTFGMIIGTVRFVD